MKKKIVVLSGAGISAESGINTFRDSNGLWENHRIEDVASPEGFSKNPQLVLDFYNQRRRQLLEVQPNEAHLLLAELENYFDVCIITQNVDDLHERAGSSKIIHLHGELLKVRPLNSTTEITPWTADLHLGDTDTKGVQLRPHILWFGESVPKMIDAIQEVQNAAIFIVIGTSLQVYPAASLTDYIPNDIPIFAIDPHLDNTLTSNENFFSLTASKGMKKLKTILLEKFL